MVVLIPMLVTTILMQMLMMDLAHIHRQVLVCSPSVIVEGQSATLTWNISNSTSRSLSGVGSISANSSLTVTPTSTTTYTINASYYSYNSDTESKTLTVYVKPEISVTLQIPLIVDKVRH